MWGLLRLKDLFCFLSPNSFGSDKLEGHELQIRFVWLRHWRGQRHSYFSFAFATIWRFLALS